MPLQGHVLFRVLCSRFHLRLRTTPLPGIAGGRSDKLLA